MYEEVKDSGQKVTSVRWVITQKYRGSKMTYKARLVAKEFEEKNLQDIRKDSSTCCKDNFCSVLCIILSKSWTIHSVDVKFVFLPEKRINRYMFKTSKRSRNIKNLETKNNCLWTL